LRGFPNPKKRFHFRFPPGTSRSLHDAGVSLLLFANNHAFDYGETGFLDSLEDFDSSGMPFVGAGRNEGEAEKPREIQAPGGGRPITFIGFARYPGERLGFSTKDAAAGPSSPGIATDSSAALDSIRIAAAGAATVIVLVHGGTEYVESPSGEARSLYRQFSEAGACLVLGSHPHVLQGIEARGSSLIAYSLGNFLFTEELEPEQSVRSALVSFLLYRGLARGFLLDPVTAGIGGSRLEDDEASRLALELRFSRLCAALEARN
jgi:poly-gamma-glutamate synthesis protein (capsule biosynthesis protein)